MRAATNQEWDHDKVWAGRRLYQRIDRRVVIEEGGEDLPGYPAATQRVREMECGGAALRVPPCPMSDQCQGYRPPVEAVLAHQLRHPSSHQSSDSWMGPDWSGLPQPEL